MRVLLPMIVAAALLLSCAAGALPDRISLAGTWRFKLDPKGAGAQEKWFDTLPPDVIPAKAGTIRLPGSTDEQGFGNKATKPAVGHLTRMYEYVGPAWYQRDVTIPAAWTGRRITLSLERCHWETTVWVDGKRAGTQNSLCAPQVYDLSDLLTPGSHRLTLCVDNTVKIDIGGWGHSITDETQTNWNGIVGRIELIATDPVWCDAVAVYPDIRERAARVKVRVGNRTGEIVKGTLTLKAAPRSGGKPVTKTVPFTAPAGGTGVETVLPMGNDARLWDEFSPALYDLRVSLRADPTPTLPASGEGAGVPPLAGGRRGVNPLAKGFTDERAVSFGMREFGRSGRKFALNGRPIYLRGTLECCIFPKTGYPPTDAAAWRRIFHIARSYGLNHFRFHSWCPPEAAFAAADEAGIMFQVELPLWVGDVAADPQRAEYERAEADRILDAYGNHPSFCLMSMGNELGDPHGVYLSDLVRRCRQKDPRHLYTCATGAGIHKALNSDFADDYFVEPATPKGWVRGQGVFEAKPPATDYDYRASLEGLDRPLMTHEMGQWAMFPNFKEVAKYTGPLRPLNFEVYRESLAKHGMADQAESFLRASGALSVALYKEEIEAVLRTPDHAGFQLLDVRDFPGQGTALVGMLDPFWDSKGLTTPEQFRQYCSPTVPLLRMKSRVWTSDETFTAAAEVAHYGPAPLRNAAARWTITDAQGGEIAAGVFPAADIPTGRNTFLGEIKLPLSRVNAPAKLTVTIYIGNPSPPAPLPFVRGEGRRGWDAKRTPLLTKEGPGEVIPPPYEGRGRGEVASNRWDFWVYPAETQAQYPSEVVIAHAWNEETKTALASGRKVLLLPPPYLLYNAVPGSYTPVFWCFRLFPSQPGTMGILCDPKHPALAAFPTEFHTTAQWWDLLTRSKALKLDATPAAFRPIVQVIDNFDRNQKLGALFEARVGKGALMVCSMDLQTDLDWRPAARQLLFSLLAYIGSGRFRPGAALPTETLDAIFVESPLRKYERTPGDLRRAVLNVRAARNVPLRQPQPWQQAHDEIIARQPGFDYRIGGGTWRDEDGSSWHDGNLVAEIVCPKGFEGTLYAHFHDWNRTGRSAEITFNGRDIGLLAEYEKGVWLALPVTAADSAQGRLSLSAVSLSGPNAQITQIVLVPR
jgi:hypothetical protein